MIVKKKWKYDIYTMSRYGVKGDIENKVIEINNDKSLNCWGERVLKFMKDFWDDGLWNTGNDNKVETIIREYKPNYYDSNKLKNYGEIILASLKSSKNWWAIEELLSGANKLSKK